MSEQASFLLDDVLLKPACLLVNTHSMIQMTCTVDRLTLQQSEQSQGGMANKHECKLYTIRTSHMLQSSIRTN